MATSAICSIPDCGKPLRCRGWCEMHYTRVKRHGDPLFTKTAPEGAGLSFLLAALGRDSDACIEWPYSKDRDGYGQTFYNSKVTQTHRLVCLLAHGEPPSQNHQAAHSCGNPPCINKSHLRWRTPGQNIAEKEDHGTKLIGAAIPSAKLDDEKVARILTMRDRVMNHVADEFGVSATAIRSIWQGRTWRHVSRHQD